MALWDFFRYQFKEKYNSDPHFADHLTPKYKQFEIKYNEILKEKYPSITDEMKRQMWVSRKIKISHWTLNNVASGLRKMISTNFEDLDSISDENAYLVRYLTEKKTGKLYKVRNFDSHHYFYSTLGEKAILSVKFDLKQNFFKNKVIIKYSQGYLSEVGFTFVTYGETKQMVDAKLQFNKQVQQIEYRLKNYFTANEPKEISQECSSDPSS